MPKQRTYLLAALCLVWLQHAALASLDQANIAHTHGDLASARAALNRVLVQYERGDRSHRVASHNLAVLRASEGDVEGAIATLESVLTTEGISAAAFGNLKMLRAFQASQSLNEALGKQSKASPPELLWLSAPKLDARLALALSVKRTTPAEASEEISAFAAQYAATLTSRNAADYLGLYALAYTPSDGGSRSNWQSNVVRGFVGAQKRELESVVTSVEALNKNLVALSFNLRDRSDNSSRQRHVLIQRNFNNQWKILSELRP